MLKYNIINIIVKELQYYITVFYPTVLNVLQQTCIAFILINLLLCLLWNVKTAYQMHYPCTHKLTTSSTTMLF